MTEAGPGPPLPVQPRNPQLQNTSSILGCRAPTLRSIGASVRATVFLIPTVPRIWSTVNNTYSWVAPRHTEADSSRWGLKV